MDPLYSRHVVDKAPNSVSLYCLPHFEDHLDVLFFDCTNALSQSLHEDVRFQLFLAHAVVGFAQSVLWIDFQRSHSLHPVWNVIQLRYGLCEQTSLSLVFFLVFLPSVSFTDSLRCTSSSMQLEIREKHHSIYANSTL